MIYFSFVFLIFCFLKSFYYGIFELKNHDNKRTGIFVIFLSFVGLIIPTLTILFNYN